MLKRVGVRHGGVPLKSAEVGDVQKNKSIREYHLLGSDLLRQHRRKRAAQELIPYGRNFLMEKTKEGQESIGFEVIRTSF